MASLALDPQLLIANANAALGTRRPAPAGKDKARAQAEDFEAMFLSSMVQHMFTGTEGEGPLGSSSGVWRSFLTDAYAKSMVKAGGIGLADQVYRSLIAQQEARAK
jgi:Rod binding domain-containing protein